MVLLARQTSQVHLCLFHRLDMASFVTTWMDPEATALIAETQAVNIVDTSQYPQCTEMEQRSVLLQQELKHFLFTNVYASGCAFHVICVSQELI